MLQPSDLLLGEWRTLGPAEYGVKHVARPEEIRAKLKEADGSLHRLGVTSHDAVQRPLKAAGKCQFVVSRVEDLAGALPFVAFVRASIPLRKCRVHARMQPRDLFGV